MVKITYQPWEEVVIHDSIQYLLNDIVKIRSLGVPAGGLGQQLLWVDGIAFIHSGMPPTDDVVKEQLQGKLHWTAVEWALMPEYKEAILIKETNVRIPIVNVSTNAIFRDVAVWLKNQAKTVTILP